MGDLRVGNRAQAPAVSESTRLASTDQALRRLRRQALLPMPNRIPHSRRGAARARRGVHNAGTLTLSACSRPGYPPLSEIVQPMTRTADVPARDSLSQILCAAAALEPQPVTLPSGTAHLNEAIDDSLIPRLKIKRLTAAALPWIPPSRCTPGATQGAIGSQISRPMPAVSNCAARPPYISRARALRCADVYGFGWRPHDGSTRHGPMVNGPWRWPAGTARQLRPGCPPFSEMVQPMLRTADVPARESVSQILCIAAALEPQTVALPSRTAHLNEAIDDSLIPRLKINKPRRRIALDAAITLRAGSDGGRHREPDFPTDAGRFLTPRARALNFSRTRVAVCGCVRIWEAGGRWV